MAKGLGLPERAALVVLATEGGSIRASELNEKLGTPLARKQRDSLVEAGLIESERAHRTYRLTMTQKGWQHLDGAIAEDAQPRTSKVGGAALLALVGALSRRGIRLSDLLGTATPPPPPAEPLEERIEATYRRLAPGPSDWVPLRDLRSALTDVARAALDDTIRQMRRDKRLTLTLEDDQSALTKADRDAALRIGPDDMHYLRMD